MRIGTTFLVCLLSIVPAQAAPNPSGSNPWIYFADNNARTINRLRMDGSGFQVLANTDQALVGLTIDTTSRHLYWSDNPQNGFARLHRAELDGSNVSIAYQAAVPNQRETIGQLALDERSQRMYWIDSGAGRIRAMNLDGSGPMNIIENDHSLDTALELDLGEQAIYFTTGSFDANTAKIERVQIDGSGRQVIANTYAYSIFLDKQQNRILGADWHDGWIFELMTDGLQRSNLFPAHAPRDVQRYADFLIYSDLSDRSLDGENGIFSRIVRSNLDGTNPIVLREINRLSQPADPIAFFILVPEPSTLFLLAFVTFSWLTGRSRRLVLGSITAYS